MLTKPKSIIFQTCSKIETGSELGKGITPKPAGLKS